VLFNKIKEVEKQGNAREVGERGSHLIKCFQKVL
jgi:hypothetical protein